MVPADVFYRRIQTERKARQYWRQLVWRNGRKSCTRCHSYRIYQTVGQRYRCKRCRYTFGDWTGRWLGQLKITATQRLWVLKLFELEVSARRLSHEVGLSYPTALKAGHVLRQAIVAHAAPALLQGEVEMDEAYFGGRRTGKRGRGAAGKVPVFGILERRGKAQVEAVTDVTAQRLLDLALKKVRRGSIVYTDKFKSYDSLMCCGYRHLRIDHRKVFATGKVYINGVEGFWSYAKERLIKFHGVSTRYFPLYLKEMEFRYNHRGQSLFDLLAQLVTKPVSDR
jgi:transposase